MGKYSELSFFSHRIRIKIEGFRLNRLMNLAMKEGIQLKLVRMLSETELICWVSCRDFKKLYHLSKSLYRITVLDAQGPVPQAKAFFRRPGLVIGCLLAIVMVAVQGFFVESIQINGYRAIPEQVLRECLEKEGIVRGAFRPEIDWAEAERKIYDTFPQVSWAQLVYSGRMVILNISETDHDIYGVDIPTEHRTEEAGGEAAADRYINLVAGCSGYIESILPYYGHAMAEKGDYVEEGQVLISGCVPIEPTTYTQTEEERKTEYFVNAQGEVWAAVPYKLTFHQERYLWGIPSDGSGTVVNKTEKTEEQAKKKAEQQIRLWEKENLTETAEIIKKSLKFSRVGNIIEVSVLLEVRQQIAIPQEETIGTKITDTRDN